MKITTEQLDTNVLTLIVEIEKSDYEQEYDARLRKARKELNLKGFRPGQVPIGLAKKMVGPRLRFETVQEMLDKAVSTHFEENKILTFSRLLTNELQQPFDMEKQEDFEFRLDVGIVPDCPIDSSIKISRLVPREDDAYIQERIEENRILYGTMEESAKVTADSVLRVDFEATDDKGNSLAEPVVANLRTFNMEKVSESAQGALLDKEVGAVIDVAKLSEFFPNDVDRKHMLGLHAEEEARIGESFRLTIKEILQRKPATVDKAFFTRFLDTQKGEELPEDTEALTELFKTQLLNEYRYHGEVNAAEDLFDTLLGKWDFTVSDTFLKRMVEGVEQREEEWNLEEVGEILKSDALAARLFSLIDKEAFESEREEIEEFRSHVMMSMLKNRLLQMGIPAHLLQSSTSTLQFANAFIHQKNLTEDFEALDRRLLGARQALKQVTVKEKELSLSEFMKELEKRKQTEEKQQNSDGNK